MNIEGVTGAPRCPSRNPGLPGRPQNEPGRGNRGEVARRRFRGNCPAEATPLRPCERCKEANEYLEWLYMQRDRVAVLLRALRQLVRVFPEEVRELLAEVVLDILLASKEVR